jgi:putative transcriptional regulator
MGQPSCFFAYGRRVEMTGQPHSENPRSAPPLLLCVVLCLVGLLLAAAQDQPDQQGKVLFLVARDVITDPIFGQSAIVMLPATAGADNRLVVGLVINKPAHLPLNQFFPDDPVLKARTATVYFGGPVEPGSLGIIFRSPKPVKQATLLLGDVFVSFDSELIRELLRKPEPEQNFRLFAGRAQWSPAQLQNEMLGKAWYPVRADTGMIFSTDPQYVWRTLFELAQPSPVVKFPRLPGSVATSFAACARNPGASRSGL